VGDCKRPLVINATAIRTGGRIAREGAVGHRDDIIEPIGKATAVPRGLIVPDRAVFDEDRACIGQSPAVASVCNIRRVIGKRAVRQGHGSPVENSATILRWTKTSPG